MKKQFADFSAIVRNVPALGCLITAIPMTVLLSLLAFAIPDEAVPRIVAHADGSHEYVFQSLEESVLWPAGATLLIVTLTLYSVVFRAKKDESGGPEIKSPRWLLIASVKVVLLLMLCFLFLGVIVIQPLSEFRTARVANGELQLSSLYRTWTVQPARIVGCRVVRTDGVARDGDHTDLQVLVTERSGRVHRSVKVRIETADRRLREYTKAMSSLVHAVDSLE